MMNGDIVTRKDQIIFWGSISLFLLFALVLISSFTKLGPFSGKYIKPRVMMTIFHSRFSVYTRRPGEPIHQLYKVEGSKLVLQDVRPFVPRFWFGLKRENKVIAAETDAIVYDTTLPQLKYSLWLKPGQTLNDIVRPDTLRFREGRPPNVLLLHGKYVVTTEPPVYYRDRNLREPIRIAITPVNITDQ